MKMTSITLKKLIFITIALIFAPFVQAGNHLLCIRDNWYFTGQGDLVWYNPTVFKLPDGSKRKYSYDPGFGVGLSLGKACRFWRAEVEFFFRKSNVMEVAWSPATGYVRDFSVMVNGFWDFEIPITDWMWYIGAGVGVSAHQRVSCSDSIGLEKESDTLFAWQAMTGFSYEIIKDVYISLGYRLFSTPKVSSSFGKSEDWVYIHGMEFSIRVDLL